LTYCGADALQAGCYTAVLFYSLLRS
jgi:hypothetical protein